MFDPNGDPQAPAYHTVRRAIEFMVRHHKHQPTLAEIASRVHMSEFHFQRTFTQWAGISPKKFQMYLTTEALKKRILQSNSISSLADEVGLSAPSRVHDYFVKLEQLTPGEYRSGGKGMEIRYGFGSTIFGDCFVAGNHRGIISLSFADANHDAIIREFAAQWPHADIREDSESTQTTLDTLNQVLGNLDGSSGAGQFHILVRGTPFQIKVWEALLKIPAGNLVSYQQLAQEIGHPKANRAVGTAVGKNPVSWLIPCHRVIRQEGVIGNYHWDPIRKTAMLGVEAGLCLPI